MDDASGFPNSSASTWFAPASEAPRDAEGHCLIAAIPPIGDARHDRLRGALAQPPEQFGAPLKLTSDFAAHPEWRSLRVGA
jgi:hypothetical protein